MVILYIIWTKQQIHGVANKWIAIEQDTESKFKKFYSIKNFFTYYLIYLETIKEIVAQDERLMPGALYISVAGLAGTIIARNRMCLIIIFSIKLFILYSVFF